MIAGVAVVTGAGRGVGLAIARRLAERGARLVLADLDMEQAEAGAALLRDEGHAAWAHRVDVADEGAMEALADFAVTQGALAAWVNNAGISHRAPLLELSVADWDRVFAVNARSAFLGTRAAGRRMGTGGAIVNIASISAVRALPDLAHYGASKGAVELFTRHAALDLAPRGIRVNAVAPGTTRTPMTQNRLSDPAQMAWSIGRIPLGRIAEPEDIAGPVGFLCSSEAAYVTGATLVCDGGWMIAA
jgi:NAD(P)-dependent dehydrogenase (short-subunit alcohol dehydrogenase family)